jgi:SulP family sulfate permease
MKLVGLTNVVGGLFGSVIGYYSLSLSGLNHQLARGSRLTSLIAAAFVLTIFLLGTSVLSYIPRMLLGGMLMYLAISFLIRWVVEARQRFSPFEYGVIWLILAVIALVGFLPGVGVGLVAAVILFVISYSQINVVKHTLSGRTYKSRVTRGREPRRFLDEQGEQIHILQLQGFIFFGTAHRLVEQVRDRVLNRDLSPLLFLVLDFRQVTGVDSTAMLSFAKLKQLADENGMTVVLTHLPPSLKNSFDQSTLNENPPSLQFFPDLDRGVAWCEETILQDHDISEGEQTLLEQLQPLLVGVAKAE